jgi:hypothetical protein
MHVSVVVRFRLNTRWRSKRCITEEWRRFSRANTLLYIIDLLRLSVYFLSVSLLSLSPSLSLPLSVSFVSAFCDIRDVVSAKVVLLD